MRVRKFLILLICLLLGAEAENVRAQVDKPDDGPIKDSAELVRKHVQKVMKEEPAFEKSYGERVVKQIHSDSKAQSYPCLSGNCEGAREHPWKQSGNPSSMLDWILDSALIKQYAAVNFPNRMNLHGCYQFGLLSHSYKSDFTDFEGLPYPESASCAAYCLVSSMFVCPEHAPPWWSLFGDNQNGHETAMYWFPEYQVATNNYGINRMNPALIGQPKFTRQALIGQKKTWDQQKSTRAGQTYPYDASKFEPNPRLEQEPFYGNGWAGFYTPDFEEKRYVHVYRTFFSADKSDQKLNTQKGWQVDPAHSILDSFMKKTQEHDRANVWTEYGMWDLVTSIPQMSAQIYGGQGGKIMGALFGKAAQQKLSEAARDENPFWKTQGAAAYRIGKWPDMYGDLGKLYKIQGSSDDTLKEVVYRGGYELYPLTSNMTGFGAPTLSSAAVIARRGLYLAGENQHMMPYYVSPKARIVQYTINQSDKSREIDKLQRLRPLKDLITTSECFRSQNILNMTDKDQGLEAWTDQNLPRSLLKYTMEPDFLSIQGNDASFVYWNRRTTCHCRYCGISTGSIVLDDGDKLYDQEKRQWCSYPPGSSFSAWQGTDTYKKCSSGLVDQFQTYRGLNDKV